MSCSVLVSCKVWIPENATETSFCDVSKLFFYEFYEFDLSWVLQFSHWPIFVATLVILFNIFIVYLQFSDLLDEQVNTLVYLYLNYRKCYLTFVLNIYIQDNVYYD